MTRQSPRAEPFPAFGATSFNTIAQGILRDLAKQIEAEDPGYLQSVKPEEYLPQVVAQHTIEPLTIDFANQTVSTREEMHRAERFDIYSGTDAGQLYKKHILTFHIPFAGDEQMLRWQPNPSSINGRPIYVRDGELCFDVIDHRGHAGDVDRDARSVITSIKENLQYLTNNINAFNPSLWSHGQQVLRARVGELQRRSNVVGALNIPVKRVASIPPTLAIPLVRKQIPSPRKQSTNQPQKHELTLDETVYQDILQTIQDMGRVFERLPSTYADKDEETLRDLLILQLEPRFEWSSTTGETFNRSGKTDILIRYEKANVFVAECKFWRGQKAHFATIDQLLGYLTWRDSKTAIVYFVDTKEVSAPLDAIRQATTLHPCFVADRGVRDGSRFSYEFHLPGDNNMHIRTEVLCFHLPKP